MENAPKAEGTSSGTSVLDDWFGLISRLDDMVRDMTENREPRVVDWPGTIRQAVFSPAADFSEAFPGLIIDMPDGTVKTVWILSDPEGNDAGFLDVESSELL